MVATSSRKRVSAYPSILTSKSTCLATSANQIQKSLASLRFKKSHDGASYAISRLRTNLSPLVEFKYITRKCGSV